MTLMEVCVLIHMMDNYYDRKTGIDTARIYAFMMRDIRFEDAKAAVEKWIKAGKTEYMTVADIREWSGNKMTDAESRHYAIERDLSNYVNIMY